MLNNKLSGRISKGRASYDFTTDPQPLPANNLFITFSVDEQRIWNRQQFETTVDYVSYIQAFSKFGGYITNIFPRFMPVYSQKDEDEDEDEEDFNNH